MLKNKKLYYVGGVVRDEVLQINSYDTDYCYEGNAIEFAKSEGLNILKVNPQFGTVRVRDESGEIDIASTRIEKYPSAGHLPVVESIGCSLKEDLCRRDFTVNALAKNTLTGEITDYFGGLNDIKNKKLRVLHEKSFIDDPTRIVRGLKFSVRFGFELENETKKLQEAYLNAINYEMSYYRLKKELIETFNLNKHSAYDKFIEQNIYKLLGEGQKVPNINSSYIEKTVTEYEPSNVWLMYLGFFDLTNLPLTRSEKRILDWKSKLNIKEPTNNTPLDSIIMHRIENQR